MKDVAVVRQPESFVVKGLYARVEPPTPPAPDPPPPIGDDDALRTIRYEADQAKARADKLAKELEEAKKLIPSDEQRARIAALERQAETDEEEKRRKNGEFDLMRAQMADKHQRELDGERQQTATERARAEAAERELEETLISEAFARAHEWFGPEGKTVMLPDMAQSYFRGNVSVETVPGVNGGPSKRRVIVKDLRGVNVVDPRSGQPQPFEKAIGEVIESHPQKNYLLRGSGKVGSGSAGGANSGDGRIDTSKLKAKDFADPAVRAAVRAEQESAGGLVIGPAFQKIERGGKP